MDGLIYFSYSKPHLTRLAVSLWTLRQSYSGPVSILNAGGDDGLVERIASDKRIDAIVIPIQIQHRRRHTAYCGKPSLWRWTPYKRSLYLDADTIVVRDPSEALKTTEPLVVTQMSDWLTNGKKYRGRISQWLDVQHESYNVSAMARWCLDNPFPAINTGVFVFDRSNTDLSQWESLTHAGAKCSFTDEYALQILLPSLRHQVLDDSWNASPIYHHCNENAVRIWHFHGCKNLKKEVGKAIWWPVFQNVLALNIGGIQEWYTIDKSFRGIEVTT